MYNFRLLHFRWMVSSAAFSKDLLSVLQTRELQKENAGSWNKENALIKEEQNLPSAPSYRWEQFLLFNECICTLCSRWNLWAKSAEHLWKSMNLHQFAQLKLWLFALTSPCRNDALTHAFSTTVRLFTNLLK